MSSRQDWASGFTLLEVLVSLIILLIGLLGIAILMLKGQRASFEGYQRQQALAMAQEMAEKIRANQGGAPYYVTGTTDGNDMPGQGNLLKDNENNCSDACTPEQIAAKHLATWDGMLVGAAETKDVATNTVGGIIGARGCIEWPEKDAAMPVFWVSVAWQGEGDTVAPANNASACGQGLYGKEERRRLVTLRVSTCVLNALKPWGCAS
ncbi:Type IV pilus modification protein PilV [Candidatus Accumulibacter aalborgensis]|uniref:Type IV pilus modification protein PilV n=1 Tax=Candidatus Accumulibacter aalborgensis TaxID=1860102 RepID=A0A1A8XGL7_9PROT|nr:type IV pilus modification protein PilV [Candidatus Accumulibacter aalborgensis]SBT04305.1 Type IV pilus modification protein PilV [Candidatus Accumulibacter aalborgensis]